MSFDFNCNKTYFLSLKEIINFTNDYYSERRDLITNEQYLRIEELIKKTFSHFLKPHYVDAKIENLHEKRIKEIKEITLREYEKVVSTLTLNMPKNKFDPINNFLKKTSQFKPGRKYLKDIQSPFYKEKLEEFVQLYREVNEEPELNGDIFEYTCLLPFEQAEQKINTVSKNIAIFQNYLNFNYDLNRFIITNLRYELDISIVRNIHNLEYVYRPIIYRLYDELEKLDNDFYYITPKINNLLKFFIKQHIELFIRNNANPGFMLNIGPRYLDLNHTSFLERLIIYNENISNQFNDSYIENISPEKIYIARDFIYYGYTSKNENLNKICRNFYEIRKQAEERSQQLSTESLKELTILNSLPVELLEIISGYALSILTIPHHCRMIQQEQEAAAQGETIQPTTTCCIIS